MPRIWASFSGGMAETPSSLVCGERHEYYQPSPFLLLICNAWKLQHNAMKLLLTIRPLLPRAGLKRKLCVSRSYAVQAPGSPTLQIFDRHAKIQQKERAAKSVETSRQADYLKDEVAIRLSERLLVWFRFNWPRSLLIERLGHKSPF